jgi:hypothetical protein
MNSLKLSVIISSIISFSATLNASNLTGDQTEKRFKPFVMRSGLATNSVINEQLETERQANIIRSALRQSALSEDFVDTYRRAFQYHFTHTVDPITLSYLPEEIALVVPPALINKADIMGKYNTEKKKDVIEAVLPSLDENDIDYRQMSLGFLRLSLIVKDADEFSGDLLLPVKHHLMKLCLLESAKIAEMIVGQADVGKKTDAHTSIGQLYRWASAQAREEGEVEAYQDVALKHFSEAGKFVSFIEDQVERAAYEKKLTEENAKIYAEKLVKMFSLINLSKVAVKGSNRSSTKGSSKSSRSA